MSIFGGEITTKIFSDKHYSPAIPDIGAHTWHTLSGTESITITDNYFIIHTMAGKYVEDLYISLPAEGGVRLQSLHEMQKEKGILAPEVNNAGLLEPSALTAITYENNDGAVSFTGTDGTSVKYTVTNSGFCLQLHGKDGHIIDITNEQISFAYDENGEVISIAVQMPLQAEEALCGGGERFNDTNQVGHSVSLTNVDCPSADPYTYNNVPLFHSNRGYSLWFNMTGVGQADFGDEDERKYTVRFDQPHLDMYLWAGTPLENIKKYTDITGTSGVYEMWAYGFWTGGAHVAFYKTRKMDAFENLKDLFEGYKEHYNFYPEGCYGEGTNGKTQEPLAYANERNIKMFYWYQPVINHNIPIEENLPDVSKYPTFDENGNMLESGYPVSWVTEDLKTGTFSFREGNKTWVDFSNPTAPEMVKGSHRQFWDWGLSGAMLDYGEICPFDCTHFNGISAKEMHNFNSYYYAKVHNAVWTERLGNEHVLFMRSGTAGTQYYVGNFLGDQYGTWEHYLKLVYAMVNLGASGFNLYGGDLGALLSRPSNDLWNRWVVMCVFSPFMRQHGAVLHMPWSDYGALAAKTFGAYYYFRKNIVPTVASAVMDANKHANPVVKGMIVAYPEQKALAGINNQYVFCDDFLVCAVTKENTWFEQVTLPTGSTWYDLYSYKAYTGGQTMYAEAPTSTMPVFVKGGAVKAIDLPQSLMLGAEMHDASGDEFEAMPALLITAPDAEKTVTIHVKDGISTDFRTYASHTETYTIKPTAAESFVLQNMQASARRVILALGVTASNITVDGLQLTCLDHRPHIVDDEYGYFVDRRGMTTIVLPQGWKMLTVTKGENAYIPLSLTTDATAIADGKAETAHVLSANGVTVGLEDVTAISRIVVKWATGYCSAYTIEYSVDGETWVLLQKVTDSCGAINTIDTAQTEVKFLRVLPLEKGDTEPEPAIYCLEVYA